MEELMYILGDDGTARQQLDRACGGDSVDSGN